MLLAQRQEPVHAVRPGAQHDVPRGCGHLLHHSGGAENSVFGGDTVREQPGERSVQGL